MERVYTDSIKKMLKFPLPIGIGTTARCYIGKDGNVIKLYKDNSDTRFLLKTDNYEEKLVEISKVSNDTFIGPKKLLYIDDKLAGYIYEYIKGNELEHIKRSTKLSQVFNNFEIVLNNIKKISDSNFILRDVHGKNILFNGEYHVIDLDRGVFEDYDPRTIYNKNTSEVFITLIDQIYGLKPWQDARYSRIDINKYKYNDVDMNLINDLCSALKEACEDDNPTIRKIRRMTLDKKFINTYEEEKYI